MNGNMCYKEELQKKNADKLQKIFDEDNTPDFIQEFFLRIASRAARVKYYYTIRGALNWFIEKGYTKSSSISKIIPEDLDGINSAKFLMYFGYLKDEMGIQLSTIQTKKNQLGSFWEYLKIEEYVRKNVIHNIKSEEFKPARTNRRKLAKMPLHEDIIDMIDNMDKIKNDFIRTRNSIVLRVLRGTGLREFELSGLNIDDVFLDEEFPYILVFSKGTYDFSDNGKDIVYLTKDAALALSEWIEYREGLCVGDQNALFLNTNGKRLSEDNIRAIFKKFSNGRLTPHMMRHEYTSILQRETNDATFVQEQGRWKSQKVMTSTYDSGASRSLGKLANM